MGNWYDCIRALDCPSGSFDACPTCEYHTHKGGCNWEGHPKYHRPDPWKYMAGVDSPGDETIQLALDLKHEDSGSR